MALSRLGRFERQADLGAFWATDKLHGLVQIHPHDVHGRVGALGHGVQRTLRPSDAQEGPPSDSRPARLGGPVIRSLGVGGPALFSVVGANWLIGDFSLPAAEWRFGILD